MSFITKRSLEILCLALILIISSCKKDDEGKPKDLSTIQTLDADSIQNSSAVLYGKVDKKASAGSFVVRFYIKEENSASTSWQMIPGTEAGSDGLFKASVKTLVPGRIYEFKAAIFTSGSTIYGDIKKITTLAGTTPAVLTLAAENIDYYNARLKGSISNLTKYNVQELGFISSTDADITISKGQKKAVYFDGSFDNFYLDLKDLQDNTRYYYRTYIKDNEGTVIYGEVLHFSTVKDIRPATLKVEWENINEIDYFAKEDVRIKIYETEEQWKNSYNVEPVFNRKFSSGEALFEGLENKVYWIKVFYAYNHGPLVIHNQESHFKLEAPLKRGETTVFKVKTKTVTLTSFKVNSVVFATLEDVPSEDLGKKVLFTFFETYTPGYAHDDATLDKSEVSNTGGPYTYTVPGILINSYKSWWTDPYYYVIINLENSFYEKFYEIDIIKLMNDHGAYKDTYDYYQYGNNKLTYTVKISWN